MDLSKLPDSQRQELEQLQKQFQEHQAQQRKQQQQSAAAVQQPPPPAYDPFQVHQPYNPPQAYDQSYYYNYQDPSQHHHQQSHQQYDASYYHHYYANSYQQQHYTHSESMPATAYAAPIEPQRNLGLGQVHDPYANIGNQGNLGGAQPNLGYPGPSGFNPTAAAAVAALSHLTQFAGSMAAVEHYNPVGPTSYRSGGRRGGGPLRGDGHGRGRGGSRARRERPVRHHGPLTAWCELCKVDCTRVDMLEQHNKGRRHKKNLRLLQKKKRADPSVDQPVDPSVDQPVVPPVDQPVVPPVDQPVVPPVDQPVIQPVDQPVIQSVDQPVVQTEEDPKLGSDIGPELPKNDLENEPDIQTKAGDDDNNNNNSVETKENENQEKTPRMKRKMRDRVRGTRGPRGSRRSRWRDGDNKRMRPTGPRQMKQVIPLMCDLCNIKCDTQEMFNKHATGKRHIAKLRRFQGHQARYGATVVQALYPPNPLSQTLAPQPVYYGEPSAYPPPYEAYIPRPYQAENPNPQLADAPLEFGTQTHGSNGVQ